MAVLSRATLVLEAENQKLLRKLDQSEKRLDRFRRGAKKSISPLKNLFAGLAAGAGVIGLGASITSVLRETSKLEAQLKSATGSVDAANRKFDELSKFATDTVQPIESVVKAYVRLKNIGLDPSIDALQAYGDIAAGSGKTTLDFVEAVADAVTGGFERLPEFSIKARKEGEKVSLAFGGISRTVQNEAGAIEDALQDIARENFAGNLADQAESLDGAFVKLGGSFKGLARELGQAGLTDAIKSIAESIADVTRAAGDGVRSLRGFFNVSENESDIRKVNSRIAALKSKVEPLEVQIRLAEEFPNRLPRRTLLQFRAARADIEKELAGLQIQQQKLSDINVETRVSRVSGAEEEKPTALPTRPQSKARTGISDEQKAINKLFAEGRQLTQSLLTPTEQYNSRIDILQKLLAAQAISQETATRATAQYKEELGASAREAEALRTSLQSSIFEAQGDNAAAALEGLKSEYQDSIREFDRLGDQAGKQLATKLFSLEAMRVQFDSLEQEFQSAQQRMRDSAQDIEIQIDVGVLSESEGFERIVTLQKEMKAAAEETVPVMRQLAEAIGPDAARRVEDLKRSVESLRTPISEIAKTLDDSLEGGFRDLFRGLIDGSKTAKEAVLDFTSSISAAFSDIISQRLAESLFDSIFPKSTGSGTAGGFGSFFSGLLGGLFGAQQGANFTVGPNLSPNIGGADNRLLMMRVQDGENVKVTPRGGDTNNSVVVNNNISVVGGDPLNRSQLQQISAATRQGLSALRTTS